MKTRTLIAFVMCMVMVVSVGASQIVTGVAVPQCTCVISVHGSNCPLSQCSCGTTHDESNTACPLTGQSVELTTCICDPHVHALGCPLYEQAPDITENKAASYAVTYGIRSGDSGMLSFDKASIAAGEMLGEGYIPQVTPDEGWCFSGFAIGNNEYTAESLAAFVPQEDTQIEVRLAPIDPAPASEPTPTQDVEPESVQDQETTPEQPADSISDQTVDITSEQTETTSEAPAEETGYVLSYALRSGDAGELSFDEAHVTVTEAVGEAAIPDVIPAEGYEFASFAIGKEEYTLKQLAEYVPVGNTVIEVRLTAVDPAEEAAEYALTYTLRAGDAGTLLFNIVNIAAGEAVGATGVPNVVSAEGYELASYAIGEEEYTVEALAEYVPTGDTAIEVRLNKINTTPYDDPDAIIEDDEDGDAEYWEYPPAWTASSQKHIKGNLLAAVQLKTLSAELAAYIEGIRETLAVEDDIYIREDADNFPSILAVYAVMTGQTEEFPYELEFSSEKHLTTLRSLFWSSTQVTGVSNTEGSALDVQRMNTEEIAEFFGLTYAQKQEAEALVSGAPGAATLLTGSIFSKLTDEEFSAVTDAVPDGISAERQAVLTAALSIKGKVEYFWGGKSTYVGWDERWGEMRTVTGKGSSTYGTARPLGMDCSGFVSWVFINAGGSSEMLQYIGNGTANQYKNSSAIEWNSVQPGDLVFRKLPTDKGTNHVGIVLTVNALGEPDQVIHCASSLNGVVVTDAEGFTLARRPYIYE